MSSTAAVLVDVGCAGYELDYIDEAGDPQQGLLSTVWGVSFEHAGPVRGFRWSKGLRHWPGWWWSSTSDRHVGYESWLERDHAMLMDFDSDVTASASQPFWLHWSDEVRLDRARFSGHRGVTAAPERKETDDGFDQEKLYSGVSEGRGCVDR